MMLVVAYGKLWVNPRTLTLIKFFFYVGGSNHLYVKCFIFPNAKSIRKFYLQSTFRSNEESSLRHFDHTNIHYHIH